MQMTYSYYIYYSTNIQVCQCHLQTNFTKILVSYQRLDEYFNTYADKYDAAQNSCFSAEFAADGASELQASETDNESDGGNEQ